MTTAATTKPGRKSGAARAPRPAPAPLPDSYLALIRAWPLRPIRTSADYTAAGRVLDRLAVREERTLDSGEADYMEALEILIEDDDRGHFDVGPDARTPLERLQCLMESAGTTQPQLSRIFGSAPAASMVLTGKRGLSRSQARKLAEHFRVDVGYFL